MRVAALCTLNDGIKSAETHRKPSRDKSDKQIPCAAGGSVKGREKNNGNPICRERGANFRLYILEIMRNTFWPNHQTIS